MSSRSWHCRSLYHEFKLADLDTLRDEGTMKMRNDKLGGYHDFCVACGRWSDDDHIRLKKNHPKWLAEWRKADFGRQMHWAVEYSQHEKFAVPDMVMLMGLELPAAQLHQQEVLQQLGSEMAAVAAQAAQSSAAGLSAGGATWQQDLPPPPPPVIFDFDADDVDQQLALPAPQTAAAPTASAFGMPDPDLGERMRYLEDKVMKLEGRLTVLGDQHLALSSALPHLASAVAAQNERLDKLTSSVHALYEPNSVNKA